MSDEIFRPHASKLPTADEVAHWAGGDLLDAPGEGMRLTGMGVLSEAEPSEIAFAAGDKHLDAARSSQAGLLIVPRGFDLPGRARVEVDEVWPALAAVMERLYEPPTTPTGVHSTAIIGDDVDLGEDVAIGPYCVIGDGASIGNGTVLEAHVVIDAQCVVGRFCRFKPRVTLTGMVIVGDRVLIHPGAVLGADGFKFEPSPKGPVKIPQVGAVIIEDDVEIGANTTVDRAFLYETRIGQGTKIDNLVQIAHNVRIGPHCIFAAQVGIAGSAVLGAGCMMGGSAGVSDNCTLGNKVMIGGGSKVHGDHGDGERLLGYPAIDMKDFARVASAQQRLPELIKRVRALEKEAGGGVG